MHIYLTRLYRSPTGASAGRPLSEARRVGIRGPDAADGGGLAVGARAQVAPLRLHTDGLCARAAHHLPLTYVDGLASYCRTRFMKLQFFVDL